MPFNYKILLNSVKEPTIPLKIRYFPPKKTARYK